MYPAEVDNDLVESGYSGTPQLKKLGIAPGSVWDAVAAPDLGEIWPIAERIRPAGALWIAWPRTTFARSPDGAVWLR